MNNEKLRIFSKVELRRDNAGMIERISSDPAKKTNIKITRAHADEYNTQQHNSGFLLKEDGVDYKLEDVIVSGTRQNPKRIIKMFYPDYSRKVEQPEDLKATEQPKAKKGRKAKVTEDQNEVGNAE